MPPRHIYWTIIVDDQPTAFRANDREELLPTFNRLKEKHPSAVMKWFERGKLWESREEAREKLREGYEVWTGGKLVPPGKRPDPDSGEAREARNKSWRPGGEHKDPREKFEIAKKAKWARLKQQWRGGSSPRPKRDEAGPPAPRDEQPTERRDRPEARSDRPFDSRGPARPRQPGAPRDDNRKGGWRPNSGGGPGGRPPWHDDDRAPRNVPRPLPEGRAPRSDWKPRPDHPSTGGGEPRPEGRAPRSDWKPRQDGPSGDWKPRPESRAPDGWKPRPEGRPSTGGWKPRPEGRPSSGGWKPRPEGRAPTRGWKPRPEGGGAGGGWKPKGERRPQGQSDWKPRPENRGPGGWNPSGDRRPASGGKSTGDRRPATTGWKPKGQGPAGGGWKPKGDGRRSGPPRPPSGPRDPRKRGGGGGGDR